MLLLPLHALSGSDGPADPRPPVERLRPVPVHLGTALEGEHVRLLTAIEAKMRDEGLFADPDESEMFPTPHIGLDDEPLLLNVNVVFLKYLHDPESKAGGPVPGGS